MHLIENQIWPEYENLEKKAICVIKRRSRSSERKPTKPARPDTKSGKYSAASEPKELKKAAKAKTWEPAGTTKETMLQKLLKLEDMPYSQVMKDLKTKSDEQRGETNVYKLINS